jgi:hypothetical protein
VENLRVGYPAGIALSMNRGFLLVSGLDPLGASAVVFRINLADKSIQPMTQGIEGNTESAGVHRAHSADVFAWANSDAPGPDGAGGGTVYLLKAKQ